MGTLRNKKSSTESTCLAYDAFDVASISKQERSATFVRFLRGSNLVKALSTASTRSAAVPETQKKLICSNKVVQIHAMQTNSHHNNAQATCAYIV